MSSSHGTTTTTAADANVVAVVVEGEATTTKAAKENTLKKRETLTDEYEPPFGLRNVDCISVRRLNVLDAFFKDDDGDDGDDDDGNNSDNIASQLNSIEVYFTLKRIVKDSSVFLGGGISKSSKHEQNSIRVCDDSLKTFTSKAISFKKIINRYAIQIGIYLRKSKDGFERCWRETVSTTTKKKKRSCRDCLSSRCMGEG